MILVNAPGQVVRAPAFGQRRMSVASRRSGKQISGIRHTHNGTRPGNEGRDYLLTTSTSGGGVNLKMSDGSLGFVEILDKSMRVVCPNESNRSRSAGLLSLNPMSTRAKQASALRGVARSPLSQSLSGKGETGTG